MIDTYDKGSAIIVEIEFKKNTPFVVDPAYFDPTTPVISITGPDGVDKVTDAALTKSAVGKYYYTCQTAVSWSAGTYSGKATGTDGAFGDVTIRRDLFRLK